MGFSRQEYWSRVEKTDLSCKRNKKCSTLSGLLKQGLCIVTSFKEYTVRVRSGEERVFYSDRTYLNQEIKVNIDSDKLY